MATVSTDRSTFNKRARRKAITKGLLFASPFLVGLIVLIGYPIIASGVYSFTSFNLFQPPKFVGFANFNALIDDSRFWKALANTMWLTAFGVPLTIVISLLGAHILNFPIKGQPLYRALVYIPTIVPVVVGSYLWRWMLNAEYGYINALLKLLHLPQPSWLTEPEWGRPAILMVAMWTIGSTMIIYLAALKDVPAELYEAAAIDGAGPWRRFLHITWPALTPITLFQIIVVLISYLQIFTQPFLLTQDSAVSSGAAQSGGPGDSMLTLSTYLFFNAFNFLKMGYASAIAWVLFMITAVISLLLFFTSKWWVHYDND